MTNHDIEVAHMRMVTGLAKSGSEITKDLDPKHAHLWHMATGVCTESGELLDAVKKVVIYNKVPDLDNIIEELGDIEFYLAGLRWTYGISRAETLEANIQKLEVRYGTGSYSNEQASARMDKEIQAWVATGNDDRNRTKLKFHGEEPKVPPELIPPDVIRPRDATLHDSQPKPFVPYLDDAGNERVGGFLNDAGDEKT